ncbi:MAG: thiamine diphosphokinase [Acidimicrobiia bacterium]|nr:thiamine diphosphokinase [Acidimicrobiia bacterium]
MSRIALVIAGGDPPPADLFTTLPPPVFTVAADSGINHAHALDLGVDVLVGDLDSADEASVRWAAERGATIEVHPANKDQTDLELALERAVRASIEQDLDEVVVAGLSGGRLDHWLANLLTLAGPLTASIDVTAYVGRSRVSVVRDRRSLTGRAGELVSLIAVGGPVYGITTSGLEYALRHETLEAGTSRGVSNVFAGPTSDAGGGDHREERGLVSAVIVVTSGTLLAVQPEHLVAADHGDDGPLGPPRSPAPR